MLTPSDLSATIGAGLTIREAAKMLRCAGNTIRRAAWAYKLPLPVRRARVRGRDEWLAAVAAYGPGIRPVARALGMDCRYVQRMLEKFAIDPGSGEGGNPNWRKKAA
jgi:hypothetical protein